MCLSCRTKTRWWWRRSHAIRGAWCGPGSMAQSVAPVWGSPWHKHYSNGPHGALAAEQRQLAIYGKECNMWAYRLFFTPPEWFGELVAQMPKEKYQSGVRKIRLHTCPNRLLMSHVMDIEDKHFIHAATPIQIISQWQLCRE